MQCLSHSNFIIIIIIIIIIESLLKINTHSKRASLHIANIKVTIYAILQKVTIYAILSYIKVTIYAILHRLINN